MKAPIAFACVIFCASASAQLVTGPLEPCLVEVDERRIVTVAVVDEGKPLEHATLYNHDGAVYPFLRADDDPRYSSALERAISLVTWGGDDYRWPLETYCEFDYSVPHPVHVYVYKIDPGRDFGNMHPGWFDDVPIEKNGLAVLADEMAEHQEKTGEKVQVVWRRKGRISYWKPK